ncbi:MAG TPA: YecA family protein [Woeseiaceae bacterium]|nr:YecA family protein [Woeseiaceae bacterium]
MHESVGHDQLDDALRRCGATWCAAQAHGLLCSRLAVQGQAAAGDWLARVLEDTDAQKAACGECRKLLEALFEESYRQLAERQSEFEPLLPDDTASGPARVEALSHWCEGFLHGLVSGTHPAELKAKLATEPISEIIKDTLQITRATAESDDSAETREQAWTELVEYLRVAAQLTYEELAGLRSGAAPAADESIH